MGTHYLWIRGYFYFWFFSLVSEVSTTHAPLELNKLMEPFGMVFQVSPHANWFNLPNCSLSYYYSFCCVCAKSEGVLR
jgi:hypothetical protein